MGVWLFIHAGMYGDLSVEIEIKNASTSLFLFLFSLFHIPINTIKAILTHWGRVTHICA